MCLIGCNAVSNSETQKTIFADFYIRYLTPEGQIKAEATFLSGYSPDSMQSVRMKGGVTFQGKVMGSREIQKKKFRYNYENYAPYPGEFVFEFKPDGENAIQKTFLIPPFQKFSIEDTISKSSGTLLQLEDRQLDLNESLVFLFKDSNDKTLSMEVKGPSTSTGIIIPPRKLSDLQNGFATLYLVRKQRVTSKEEHLEITASFEYYSKEVKMVLVE